MVTALPPSQIVNATESPESDLISRSYSGGKIEGIAWFALVKKKMRWNKIKPRYCQQ